jgi:hypothetical protein
MNKGRRSEPLPLHIQMMIDDIEEKIGRLESARAAVGYVGDNEDWPSTRFYRDFQQRLATMLPGKKKVGRRKSVDIEVAVNVILSRTALGEDVAPLCRRVARLMGLNAKTLETTCHKRKKEKINP